MKFSACIQCELKSLRHGRFVWSKYLCHVGITNAAAAVQNLIHFDWDCETDTDRQAVLGQRGKTHTAWVLLISVFRIYIKKYGLSR